MPARSATRNSKTRCTAVAQANDAGTSSVSSTAARSPGTELAGERLRRATRAAKGSAPSTVPAQRDAQAPPRVGRAGPPVGAGEEQQRGQQAEREPQAGDALDEQLRGLRRRAEDGLGEHDQERGAEQARRRRRRRRRWPSAAVRAAAPTRGRARRSGRRAPAGRGPRRCRARRRGRRRPRCVRRGSGASSQAKARQSRKKVRVSRSRRSLHTQLPMSTKPRGHREQGRHHAPLAVRQRARAGRGRR